MILLFNEKPLFKKKILVLAISLFILTFLLYVVGRVNDKIEIEDMGLESVIREKIDKPRGAIYQTEVGNILSLDASGREITSLKGIERIYRLADLNLENNSVEDLTPLRGLKMLKTLNLNNNGMVDLAAVNFKRILHLPLRKLNLRQNAKVLGDGEIIRLSDIGILGNIRTLEELDLRGNGITDIEPLRHLKGLNRLNIRENTIKSLEPLSELRSLKYLNIHSNEDIESLEPLRGLGNLETLIMKNVCINDLNIFRDLKKLQNLNALNCGIGEMDTSIIASLREHGALQGDVRPKYITYTAEQPTFSHLGGFYNEGFELKLKTKLKGGSVYYTQDGTEPNKQSQKYSEEEPINIGEKSDVTMVCARVIGEDENELSEISVHTYFVGEKIRNRHELPIISIVTDEQNLFDEELGIYTEDNARYRGSEWERPIHLEFFENNGERVIAQNAGVRIHGGISRRYKQKTLRIYADDKYNRSGYFEYDIFKRLPKKNSTEQVEKFSRLLLRNSGNDWGSTMFRDALLQRLVLPLNSMDTQAYRPAVLYINGQYWGIHNVRERYDEYYIAGTYKVEKKDIVLLDGNAKLVRGKVEDRKHYQDMLAFIRDRGLVEHDHYEYIKTLMDTDNYRDYVIVQTYIGNIDWPHGNIKYWRYKTDGYKEKAPYGQDGRWRWMLYDTDHGYGMFRNSEDIYGRKRDYSHNTINWVMSEKIGNNVWANFLIRSLMKNDTFKNDFLNRYSDLLNVYFEPGIVLKYIDEMQENIAPEMDRHIERWGAIKSMDDWYENVDSLKKFAIKRPDYIRKYLMEELGLDGVYTLSLEIKTNEGYVRVNTVDVGDRLIEESGKDIWDGVYFKNIPLTLEAFSEEGYKFSHWEGIENNSKERRITVLPKIDIKLKAVFLKS